MTVVPQNITLWLFCEPIISFMTTILIITWPSTVSIIDAMHIHQLISEAVLKDNKLVLLNLYIVVHKCIVLDIVL